MNTMDEYSWISQRSSVRQRVRKLAFRAITASMALYAAVAPAYATTQNGGKISSIMYAGGRILFYMNAAHGHISCSCCDDRWEISVSDANSQALMSLIMTAFAQGKTVDIVGTGSCVGTSNDTEGVSLINVQNS